MKKHLALVLVLVLSNVSAKDVEVENSEIASNNSRIATLSGDATSKATSPTRQNREIRSKPLDHVLTVRDIVEVSDLAAVSVSPDGRFAVARVDKPNILRNATSATWYWMSLDRDRTVGVLADGGNSLSSSSGTVDQREPLWSKNNRTIYYPALFGEEFAIWEAKIGGVAKQLTHDDSNVEEFALDSSRSKLLYSMGQSREAIKRAEAYEYNDGIVLDPTVEVGASLERNVAFRGRMTTMRLTPGKGYQSPFQTLFHSMAVVDLKTGERRHEFSEDLRTRFESNSQTSVPGVLATAMNERRGDIARVRLAGSSDRSSAYLGGRDRQLEWQANGASTTMVCADAQCKDLRDSVRWRPDSDEILFMSQESSGKSSLRAWNPIRRSVRTIFSTDGLLGSTGGEGRKNSKVCPTSARVAVCTIAQSAEPPRLIAIDLDTGEASVLLDPNEELRSRDFGTIEHLTWSDKWGGEITGVLVLPSYVTSGGNRFPLVITSYRCEGFLRGGGGANVPEHVLAAHGIAALCINMNKTVGNVPYPSPDVPAGQASILQSILDAWESGAALLINRGIVDQDRVAISGNSLSGEAVQYALFRSRLFAVAGSNHPTLLDPFAYYFHSGEHGDRLHALYGLPDPEKDAKGIYRAVSPALNIDHICAPILIQIAEGEFRAGIRYWHQLVEQRKAVEFIVFPDEHHQFWQPAHRFAMNQRFIDWFRFWLQSYEGDGTNLAQFNRWSVLREQAKSQSISMYCQRGASDY